MPKEGYLHIVVKGPSIEAIEPGEANNKLVAMVNSVRATLRSGPEGLILARENQSY
jgi:hypothetical protein